MDVTPNTPGPKTRLRLTRHCVPNADTPEPANGLLRSFKYACPPRAAEHSVRPGAVEPVTIAVASAKPVATKVITLALDHICRASGKAHCVIETQCSSQSRHGRAGRDARETDPTKGR